MKLVWGKEELVPALLEMGREMHDESRFRHLPLDENRLAKAFRVAIDDTTGAYFLTLALSDDDEPVGFLFGTVDRPYYTQALIAHDFAFYVRPLFRGTRAGAHLLKAFCRWAEKREVAEIHVYHTVDIEPDRFDRFVRSQGFRFVGGNYILPLS